MIKIFYKHFETTGRVEFRRTCSQCRDELLPTLIERVYGWRVGEYRLGVAEHGKPCFVESPAPAYFNISHSGGIWLCAFSDAEDGDIGIDIERVERARMSVAEYAFSAGERELLLRAVGERDVHADCAEGGTVDNAVSEGSVSGGGGEVAGEASKREASLFFRFWTAKEAYAKLLGSGISCELLSTHELRTAGNPQILDEHKVVGEIYSPDEFRFSIDSLSVNDSARGTTSQLGGCIFDVTTGERKAQITLCHIADGYICSLCTVAPPHSIEITPL